MRRSRKPIIIASRSSRLAKAQAEMVGKALAKLHPTLQIEYRWIRSQGDRHQDVMLAEHGGKGLFTGAIEDALLAGKADLAVHSLKDLPARDTPRLALAATPRRADVRDCLISAGGENSIDDLPRNAVLGTASPRRAAQVRRIRPDVRIELLRGNVETRLAKVLGEGRGARDEEREARDEGQNAPLRHPSSLTPHPSPLIPHYDATLLAAAGLRRLGLKEHTHAKLEVETMLPAACQGALAIQCRANDHVTLTRCLPLNDPLTAAAVHAERGVIAELGADCHAPVAVLAQPLDIDPAAARTNTDAHWFRLRARVLSLDGQACLEVDERVRTGDLHRLVKQVVEELIERGARQLLADARRAARQTSTPQPPAAAKAG